MPEKGRHCAEYKLLQKKYFYRLDTNNPKTGKFSAALREYLERQGWRVQQAADQN